MGKSNPNSFRQILILFHGICNIWHLEFYRNPAHNGKPIAKFEPIRPNSKPNQFNYVDVKNDGLVPKIAPNGNRTMFLDKILHKCQQLVRKYETKLKQKQCDAMSKVIMKSKQRFAW